MIRRGRKTLRETRTENNRSLSMYAGLSGKPMPDDLMNAIKPVVKRKLRTDAQLAAEPPLEKDVQKAIIEYLIRHPLVAWVTRINQGQAVETAANGETRYISFAKIYKRGVRLVDLDCQLKDGRRLAIEIKRPGFKTPRGEREVEQAAFLALVREYGGVGIFATCVEDVAAAINVGQQRTKAT